MAPTGDPSRHGTQADAENSGDLPVRESFGEMEKEWFANSPAQAGQGLLHRSGAIRTGGEFNRARGWIRHL